MSDIIKKAFTDFISSYQVYFNIPENEEVVGRINNGDCGTAAIAVGLALEKAGYTVTYYDNNNHAFIGIDGKVYDCYFQEGTDIDTMNERWSSDIAKLVSSKDLVMAYLPYDAIGAVLLKLVLGKQDIPLPEHIAYLNDHIAEFDSPEYIAPFEQRLLNHWKNEQ